MLSDQFSRVKKEKEEEATQIEAARNNARITPIPEEEVEGFSGGGLAVSNRVETGTRGVGAATQGTKFYRTVG